MIYEQSDNVTIMIGVDINEVVIELLNLFLGNAKNLLKQLEVAILYSMALKTIL